MAAARLIPPLTDGEARAFWTRVDQSEHGCWLWTGKTGTRSGHRQAFMRGTRYLVHRVAWTIAHGPISADACVLHRCDVPACVHPDHLFLGDRAANNRDRDAKGRHRPLPGMANGNRKITDGIVRLIRLRRRLGHTQRRIASDLRISQKLVWLIDNGQAWAHVTDEPEPRP